MRLYLVGVRRPRRARLRLVPLLRGRPVLSSSPFLLAGSRPHALRPEAALLAARAPPGPPPGPLARPQSCLSWFVALAELEGGVEARTVLISCSLDLS